MSQFMKFRIAPALRGLTEDALTHGLAIGEIAVAQGVLVPAISGHDPVLDALNHVSSELAQIREAETSGEDIDADRKAELEKQQKALADHAQATAEGQEDELAKLKRERQEAEEKEEAKDLVRRALGVHLQEEEEKKNRVKGYAIEALKEALGDKLDIEDAVSKALKGGRPASRWAGQGADEDFVAAISKGYGGGGSGYSVQGTPEIKVGEDREIKELERRASPVDKGGDGVGIGQFVVLYNRQKFNLPVTDAERRWFSNKRDKALAEGTPSAGGVLVPREYMPDLLGLLRAQAVVRRANPRIVRFQREMYQTSVSTGATAFYTQENAQIPMSEETFAEAPLLTPKNLTALVPVSNYLLNDAEQVEDFVRQDLAEVMALREDLAFLRGSGAGGEPRGFRNVVGITLDPIAPTGTGVLLTLQQIRRIMAVFRSMNAGAVRPVWFFNPEYLTYLETLQEMSGGSPTGRSLVDADILTYDDDTLTTGRLLGLRYFSTTQLPNGTTGGNASTELYLVNMAETIVGENQDLEIDVSREASYWDGAAWVSAYQNNQSVFRAVMRHDIAHRRPSQIVVQTGARTA